MTEMVKCESPRRIAHTLRHRDGGTPLNPNSEVTPARNTPRRGRGEAFTPLRRPTSRTIRLHQTMRTSKRRERRAPAAWTFAPYISTSEFGLIASLRLKPTPASGGWRGEHKAQRFAQRHQYPQRLVLPGGAKRSLVARNRRSAIGSSAWRFGRFCPSKFCRASGAEKQPNTNHPIT